jgi:protein TonB
MMVKNLFLLVFVVLPCFAMAQNDTLRPESQPNTENTIDPGLKDEALTVVEQMPQFIKGDNYKSESAMYKFIMENLVYPSEAVDHKIEGKVLVKFTITKTGEIKDVMAVNTTKLGFGCEEEAIRVIRLMANWEVPGKQNGVPVSVYYNLPVMFRLR